MPAIPAVVPIRTAMPAGEEWIPVVEEGAVAEINESKENDETRVAYGVQIKSRRDGGPGGHPQRREVCDDHLLP